ncbi:DUF3515 domain-containing protein [Saccharopolyspora sp. NPDC002376]
MAITLGALLALAVAGIGTYGWYTARQEQQAAEAALKERREGPLPLAPIPAPKAETPECKSVIDALPRELAVEGKQVPRRELAAPAPQATVAWGDADHDPITARCGIDAPAELTPTAQLVDVSGVSWLKIDQGGDTSWLAVDRPVYVALSLPGDTGTGPLQDLSAILRDKLPKQPVFP